MHFLKTLSLALGSLALTTSACKCVQDGTDDAATQACCAQIGGSFSGNDCAADSISENLSGFRSCCMDKRADLTSDCDFPLRRDEGSAAARKRAPAVKEVRTAGDIVTIVA